MEKLNEGLLPADYYALSEQVAGEIGPDVLTLQGRAGEGRRRLVIRHVSDDRIVAILEIVSPGNKSSRHALRDFVENAVGAISAGIGLLIVDIWPLTPRDPQGIHWAIWQEIDETQVYTPPPDKPLTLVAYVRDPERTAYVEPTARSTSGCSPSRRSSIGRSWENSPVPFPPAVAATPWSRA
jgi:hypothetical protein